MSRYNVEDNVSSFPRLVNLLAAIVIAGLLHGGYLAAVHGLIAVA